MLIQEWGGNASWQVSAYLIQNVDNSSKHHVRASLCMCCVAIHNRRPGSSCCEQRKYFFLAFLSDYLSYKTCQCVCVSVFNLSPRKISFKKLNQSIATFVLSFSKTTSLNINLERTIKLLLLANFCSFGNYYADCWGKKRDQYSYPALDHPCSNFNCQPGCSHYYNSGTTVYGRTNCSADWICGLLHGRWNSCLVLKTG